MEGERGVGVEGGAATPAVLQHFSVCRGGGGAGGAEGQFCSNLYLPSPPPSPRTAVFSIFSPSSSKTPGVAGGGGYFRQILQQYYRVEIYPRFYSTQQHFKMFDINIFNRHTQTKFRFSN